MKLDKLAKFATENKVEFIDLKLVDLVGAWHHITIPVSSLTDDLFRNGIGVDGSSMPGFSSIERGDMIMLPDPSTVFMDAFFERPTMSMIGNIMEVDKDVVSYSRDPRRVAADSEKLLAKRIKGARAVLGPEFEFYIFDRVNFFQGPDSAFYFLDSSEAPWNAGDTKRIWATRFPTKRATMWLRRWIEPTISAAR